MDILRALERKIPLIRYSRSGEVKTWFSGTEKKHVGSAIKALFKRIDKEI